MQKAQEFLINHLKTVGDSYDDIEDKSGVSKATISRMMKGQTVSTASLRLIADAYGQMDEFLAVVSASADPKRAADELHEMYKHSEQLITENCEERIRSMKNQMIANEKMRERELSLIIDTDKRVMDTLEKSVDSEKHHARVFLCLFLVFAFLFMLSLFLLVYYVGYDVTHPDMGLFGSLLKHMGTTVLMST